MNGHGFDWLNLPPGSQNGPELHSSSGNASPAPPVSFGVSANSTPNRYQLTNKSADSVLQRPHSASVPISGSNTEVNASTASLDGDSSVPLSLTTQDLTLEESRTYIRWYSDILARTNTRTISMNDVYSFLNNFKLSSQLKDQINRIFHKFLHSINIGEFFALLRIIAHSLLGEAPSRALIKYHAPIPTPSSILSKKRQSDDDNDDYEPPQEEAPQENKHLDLDSFTQFMLTGQRPDEKPRKRKKKSKSVKFSDQIVTDIHDSQDPASRPASPGDLNYSLPMDKLLERMNQQKQPDEEEQQILKDMESQINHFQNLHSVDTASIGGVPASLPIGHNESDQLLKPNMTGPAQMSQYYARQDNSSPNPQNDPSPLKPNMTGPYDMMKIFSPPNADASQPGNVPHISLQSFANEMTGNTATNTLANAHPSGAHSPLNGGVPAEHRLRSLSSPTPPSQRVTSPSFYANGAPPPPPSRGGVHNGNRGGTPQAPPPPPPRRRGASVTSSVSPPPLPAKEPLNMFTQENRSDSTANILDDLKALQAEVDKIRDMTGGF